MLHKTNCPCVLPSASEEEVVTLAGEQPGAALRLRVEPSVGGYVRFEQLAYSHDLGWYTQKTFCIPGETLNQLLPHLRRAACLIPRRLQTAPGAALGAAAPAATAAAGMAGASIGAEAAAAEHEADLPPVLPFPGPRALSPMATPPVETPPQRREA